MSDWSLTPRLERTYVSSTHHDHHHAVSSSGLSRVCEHSRARVTALRMCICRTRLTSSSSSMSADADALRRALLAFLPPCLHVIPQSGIVQSVSVRLFIFSHPLRSHFQTGSLDLYYTHRALWQAGGRTRISRSGPSPSPGLRLRLRLRLGLGAPLLSILDIQGARCKVQGAQEGFASPEIVPEV